MPNVELISWIKEQKSKGFSDKEILDYYLQSGGNKTDYDLAIQPVAQSAAPTNIQPVIVKKKKKGLVVFLISLIFLLIIAGIFFYFITSKNEVVINLMPNFLVKEDNKVVTSNQDCNSDNKISELTKNFDDLKLELNSLNQEKEELVKTNVDLSSELDVLKNLEDEPGSIVGPGIINDNEYYLDCVNAAEKCDLKYKNTDEIFIKNVYEVLDGEPMGEWNYINTVNNKFIAIEHIHPDPLECGQFEGIYAINIETKEAKNISLVINNIDCGGFSDHIISRKMKIIEAFNNFKKCLSDF
jgi:hypothetical protein